MRRAFTLVEILIIVVILGILAAIVVPQFHQAEGKRIYTIPDNEMVIEKNEDGMLVITLDLPENMGDDITPEMLDEVIVTIHFTPPPEKQEQ